MSDRLSQAIGGVLERDLVDSLDHPLPATYINEEVIDQPTVDTSRSPDVNSRSKCDQRCSDPDMTGHAAASSRPIETL
jgi:hypothetical protein